MDKRNIKSDMGVLPERWTKTPFAYSRVGSNLTLLQQDVLLRVSDELQEYIQNFYGEKRDNTDERPNCLFTPEQLMNLRPVEVKISDLGVDTHNYQKILAAVKELNDLTVDFVNHTEKVRSYYRVFAQVDVPVMENSYLLPIKKNGEEKEVEVERSLGVVKFYINPLMAKLVFDMSQGYINHLKTIAQDSKKRSTPRVYLLLTRYINQGRMDVDIAYEDLKEYLGMYERNEEGIIMSEQYPEYARFKRWVLETAKADLVRMSALDQSDIMFEYEPIYKGKSKRGNPDKVHFKIVSTPLGKAHVHMMHADAAIKKLMAYIVKQVPGIDTAQAEAVMKRVPYPYFDEYQRQAYKAIQAAVARTDINDVPTYALSTLRNLLPQEFAQAQEKQQAAANITAAKAKGRQTQKKDRQLDLFGGLSGYERWTRAVQLLCRSVDADTARATFEQLRFESYDEQTGRLVLRAPKDVIKNVEDNHIGKFSTALKKCFGDGVVLQYRPIG